MKKLTVEQRDEILAELHGALKHYGFPRLQLESVLDIVKPILNANAEQDECICDYLSTNSEVPIIVKAEIADEETNRFTVDIDGELVRVVRWKHATEILNCNTEQETHPCCKCESVYCVCGARYDDTIGGM